MVGRFTLLKHVYYFPSRKTLITYSRGPMARKKQSRNQTYFGSESVCLAMRPLSVGFPKKHQFNPNVLFKPWFLFYWFISFFFIISPFFYLALLEVFK